MSGRDNFRAAVRDGFPLALLGVALVFSNRYFTIIDDETKVLSAAVQPAQTTLGLFFFGIGQHEHPPLHDLFLHFWLRLSGGAFATLRAPSIIFFLLGLLALSRAARRMGGQSSATAVLWLGALWPYGFHFGRLAIWYSFAFLLIAALTWAYLRFCDSPSGRAYALVWLFGLALVCTNYFGWAVLALLCADDWIRHRSQAGTVRRILGAAALWILAYAPLWRAFVHELSVGTNMNSANLYSWGRAQTLNVGFNIYSLFVSESVAPWFWRFGIPATAAVAIIILVVFFQVGREVRRLLLFGVLLIVSMAGLGIVDTKRIVLAAPWVLLAIAVGVGTIRKPAWRFSLALALMVVAGIGWYGILCREYYAAPRFIEPWPEVAADAAGALRSGSVVIGNNPSFFFYLAYALKSGERGGVPGTPPDEVQIPGVWDAAEWFAAGRPLPPKIFWVRGMLPPDPGGPSIEDAGDWLDQHCAHGAVRLLSPDAGYELKQRYFPQLGERPWRVELREYTCGQ